MEDKTLPPPRPIVVTILAVLTILGVILSVGYEGLKEIVPELQQSEVPMPGWITLTGYGLSVGKLVAAILLLQMRRIGFYLYAACESVAAIFSIIGGKIAMDYMDTGYTNPRIPIDPQVLMIFLVGLGLGLTIAFIGGHASQLSKMK